jgi:hypothetical protein
VSTRTDLVLVPVVVTKSGKHVTGLQREAFRIEESGKIRSVSIFEEITTEKLTALRSARPPGYSNFLPGGPQVGRLTAIVLDMVDP